ncbi:MAG: HAD family hydrolase [Nitrospinae bacterium]|nr:HAD family hydrolase [Nitrospinota bacterium]
MRTIKAAFLDRDGTINIDKGYISSPREIELIPGAAKAIKLLNEAGYAVFGVSNQSGVARGFYGIEEVLAVNRRVEELLSSEGAYIREILYCPHHPRGMVPEYSITCKCRKPLPGMVDAARQKHGFAIADAIVIGDKICDVELGRNIGARTALVETGFGAEEKVKIDCGEAPAPDVFAPSLLEAVIALLGAPPRG